MFFRSVYVQPEAARNVRMSQDVCVVKCGGVELPHAKQG